MQAYTYLLINFFTIIICFIASFDRRIRFNRFLVYSYYHPLLLQFRLFFGMYGLQKWEYGGSILNILWEL